jgi:putative ABC transport system permease protein
MTALLAVAMALVRLVIRLYPARFRARFHADVLDSIHGDLIEASQRGAGPLLAAAARALTDALGGLLAEHRPRLRRPRFAFRDDVRDGWRSLRQSPTFTGVALVVLALGIGASTAIFSVVDAVVLRALPFDQHDRIAAVLESNPARPSSPASTMPQIFLDWRDRQQSFVQFAATNRQLMQVRNATGELENARVLRVTREFFPLLRVRPALGRLFTADDEISGRHRSAILSHDFWQRHFGGAPDVVGRRVDLNDERWEVAGVMPPGFSYPVGSAQATEIFTPLPFRAADRVRAGGRSYQYFIIGRLKDGVSLEQAAGDMERVATSVDTQFPGWNTLNPGGHVRVVALQEYLVGGVRSWMLLLLGSVTLLLLIACANVANLMLARATVRGREMGLRAALGASGWRLTRGLLVEGILLSLAAAAIGIALAYGGVQVLKAWMPAGIPRVAAIALDRRVLAATIAAALVTGTLFGSVPAIHAARPDLTAMLRAGGRSATSGRGARRLRSMLVVIEVALAVILVVGAGLFTASFVKVLRIDPGFDYRGVLAINVGVRPDPAHFKEAVERGRPYVERMLEAVRAVPGVESLGAVSGGLPLSGSRVTMRVAVPGRPPLSGDDAEMDSRVVTADYLQILRIPIVKGRYLTDRDRDGAPLVVVVNQAAAQKYWPGMDPLGQRIHIEDKDRTVVGIVGNIRHAGPEVPPWQEAYIPLAQEKVVQATLVMRTAGDPASLLPAVKRAVWSVNKDQVIYTDRTTLDSYMDGLIAQRRFNMALLALFGVLGLVISAAGIYGVMAYIVSQRTREIGVRMALGATRGAVIRLVLASAGGLVAAGLGIGGLAAWYLSAAAKTFLFQLDAKDPRAFAGAIACLTLSALAATALPAHRAASVDPNTALRAE